MKGNEMKRYKFVIEFESNDRITKNQLDKLEHSLWVQVLDPQANDGHFGWSNAGYNTGEIHITRDTSGAANVTTCNYCGGQFVDPAELAEYCPDCVAAHQFGACETAGHCEICDTDPDGFLCVDCVYHSEGIAESDAPTHNDNGTRFLQNLDDQNMTAVLTGETHDFSRAHCVGCLTTLAGYRLAVVLFDKNPNK